MLNDREEKYEGQDESEYHFSDEEVSYEVEPEATKPVVATEQKESVLNRLTRSKRMLISMGVFLVLIFVVYKMVSPSASTTPSTDITPTPTIAQQAIKAQQPPMAAVQPPAPTASVASPQNITPPAAQTTQTMPAIQPPVAPPSVTVPSQTMAQAPVSQQLPAPPASTPQPSTNTVMSPPSNVPAPAMAQQQMPSQQSVSPASTTMQPQQNMPMANNMMPSMIPVQSTTPAPQQQFNMNQSMSGPAAIGTQIPANVDTRMAAVSAESARLINQLQNDYVQKLNDYATQNKALQDQVQLLNTRLAGMENQMNQLMQALTNQNQRASQSSAPPMPAQPQQAEQPKIAYNVQAIIPGRAWLRSDNGETVTVAEGDVIKDVGRVTKIDPYDGVVEINTGTRTVSLSYGNGG